MDENHAGNEWIVLVSTLGALDSAVEMKIPQAILPSL